MPQILKINPQQPEDGLIREAVRILLAGGVAAFPTETFYGLAVDAANGEAIERIFQIKGRAFSSPIALIAGSKNGISGLVMEIPAAARRLMQAFWPGPLTLLFAASAQISPRLTAGTGKIGIRVSSHPVADSLANTLDGAITATSANLSGATRRSDRPDHRRRTGAGRPRVNLSRHHRRSPHLPARRRDLLTSHRGFAQTGIKANRALTTYQ
jgi:L-threonylcarbamoyladenylate synthase